MEDNRLRDNFKDYNPDLSSDFSFMQTLERNLDKVEIVRRHNVEIHRRARIAVFVAAVAGFVTGVIFMLFMPNLTAFSARLVDGMARMFEPISLIQSFSILPWLMTAFASVFVAMGAYEVSIALQRPRHKLILP